MSDAAKTIRIGGAVSRNTSRAAGENDVLHFLTRTLQAHYLDSGPQDMRAKLRKLKTALDRQEITLSDWPDSPSKDRFCKALAKAKTLIVKLVDEFPTTVQ